MRWLAMLLLGLAIGAFAAVTLVGAMRQATPLRKGIMAVSQHQLRELRELAAGEPCDPAAAARRLGVLRGLGPDFEAALLPTGRDDELFRRHLANYLGSLDRALAETPPQCAGLRTAVREVGAGCKRCHDDFR
jgi:hypothetical protein